MNVEIRYRELELNNPNRFENKFWAINTVEGKSSPVVNAEIEGDLGLSPEKIVEAKQVPMKVKFTFVNELSKSALESIQEAGGASVEQIQRVSELFVKLTKSIENFNCNI